MASILVLNGPNLNLLGSREPEHYGAKTLEQINQQLSVFANEAGFKISFKQSNAEHELIDMVQQAAGKVGFLIINPAAFTHTSVALRDAILGVEIPYIEVHLSNIHAREEFRKHSYFSDAAEGVICGLGAQGYELALQAAISYLQDQPSS
ncbi:MAG TPA: type II 3-dehydroquinate dehydratase [Gammaproteobacteria bacterium]|nr:type II 3-dehydroquinate dehydratase [Gammaproteobacteria bacterium]